MLDIDAHRLGMGLGQLEDKVRELSQAIIDLAGADRALEKLGKPVELKIPAGGVGQPHLRLANFHINLLILSPLAKT
jgi:hypothetical protein